MKKRREEIGQDGEKKKKGWRAKGGNRGRGRGTERERVGQETYRSIRSDRITTPTKTRRKDVWDRQRRGKERTKTGKWIEEEGSKLCTLWPQPPDENEDWVKVTVYLVYAVGMRKDAGVEEGGTGRAMR